ncbi:MAG: agmatine deiminase family protein [Acidobacteria bacterium]|nr:agmatine deiminase family protein [Acidobacteriota bacterium]MBI3655806.1 agmatine deiminase family protein [Acidobacteriota bacterium]
MVRKIFSFIASTLLLATLALAQEAAVETIQVNGATLVVVPDTIDTTLPARAETPWEEWLTEAVETAGTPGVLYPWNARPDIYGFGDAPTNPYFNSEFSSYSGLVLGWPGYVFNPQGVLTITELRDIVVNAAGRMWISIVVPSGTPRTRVTNTLNAAGVDPSLYELITFDREFPDSLSGNTLDTIWIRDYGPEFIYDASGSIGIIDMSYYPQVWTSPSNPRGRVRDDAVPNRLGAVFGMPVYRPRLAAEGGNMQTDGNGTCFVSDVMRTANARIFGAGFTSQVLANTLGDFYGCQRTVILQPLSGEGTGHIDMFMTVVSPDTILVGQYNPADDLTNANRLNQNADTLTGSGYNVVRIPMPKPYSIGGRRVWATFANSLSINDATIVPIYRNPNFPPALRDTILAQEADALSKYRAALPGITVIPIIGDPLIPSGGSLHCITMTYQ